MRRALGRTVNHPHLTLTLSAPKGGEGTVAISDPTCPYAIALRETGREGFLRVDRTRETQGRGKSVVP